MSPILSHNKSYTQKAVALLVTTLFISQSSLVPLSTATASLTSLEGYSFSCNGLNLGFDEEDIFCGGSTATAYRCGTYIYEDGHLSGDIVDGDDQSDIVAWTATNLAVRDNIVVSFSMYHTGKALISTVVKRGREDGTNKDENEDGEESLKCYVTSKDWKSFSASFYRVTCPLETITSESISIEFGKTGDVAFRSEVLMHSLADDKSTAGNDDTAIAKDYYGVYRWYTDGFLKMYFGPQHDKVGEIITGKLHRNGDLYLDRFDSSGPCKPDLSEGDALEVLNELMVSSGADVIVRASVFWLSLCVSIISIF